MNVLSRIISICSFSLLFTLCGVAALQAQSPEVTDLRVEYAETPLGIDRPDPRLFWRIESERKATVQRFYRIQVAGSREELERGETIWDTGDTESARTIHIHYAGPELQPATRYWWRVRVRDNHGGVSSWSEPSWWETGLMGGDRWQAVWIEPGLEENREESPPAPMLRREFDLEGEIVRARAYVTAHGLYELELNGARVGDHLLSPGWTSYHNRLPYRTYDVTDKLRSGANAVAVMLGDGWFRGYMGFQDQRNFYGDRLALLLQIEVTFADGNRIVIATDDRWRASTGPIRYSDIYNGEKYDARLEMPGWSLPGFDDTAWAEVRPADHDMERLIGEAAPPVRKIQELVPREIFVTPEGDTVVDMGQNMIGWVRLRVEGEAGTEVRLRHAEVLDRYGNFYTDNLRAADQENIYILGGGGVEEWEPRFTFQGFRYVAVEGFPGELSEESLTGVVLHSDMEPTGHFQSSSPLINQLQHNIVWGQKGNFLEIPTDCPQRDERLGWTGDIQVFAETANLNMNTAAFLTRWLADLAADQLENGSVPHVIPDVLPEGWDGAAGWADAAVIVPWSLYRAYGDSDLLAVQYESMKGWVDYMSNRAGGRDPVDLWNGDFTFGDWLSYSSTNPGYPGAYTDTDLISTAFLAWSSKLLSRTAGVLRREEDRTRYLDLHERTVAAFQREFLTPSGRLVSHTQTAYLLALQFGLLPDEMIEPALSHLVENIDRHGHLTTGFLGTPHLNPVLGRFGREEVAWDLLFREEYPSWLYPVTMGATTIWERWDGIRPDGTFQSEGMNSFNHYAYGAIGEWLYREVAGIEPLEPGYGRIAVRPLPGWRLSHARALVTTLHGIVESDWTIDQTGMTLHVEVPANTTAEITLPHADRERVGFPDTPVGESAGIRSVRQEGENVVVEAGSGRYTFRWQSPQIEAFYGSSRSGERAAAGPDSSIGELIADRRGRELLNLHAPGLMRSPWLSQVMGFPLRVAKQTLPEAIGLDETAIREIERELL